MAWLAAAAADDHRPRERGQSEHLAAADGSLASAPDAKNLSGSKAKGL